MTAHNLEATVKARVTRETAVRLTAHAAKVRRNVSDVVRIAIDDYLEREGKRK